MIEFKDLKNTLVSYLCAGKSLDESLLGVGQVAYEAGYRDLHSKGEQYVIHKKTGNKYYVLSDSARDATNAREGDWVVVYKDEGGRIFVRDYDEFWIKFERVN